MEEDMWTVTLPDNTSLNMSNGTQSPEISCGSDLVFKLGLYGIAMGLLCIVGFVGNTISFMVLQKDRSTPVASFLLQSLAIADNIFLLLWLIHYSVKYAMKYMEHQSTFWLYLRVYTFPIMYMAQTQTIWQTVVIALNRFMAVCMPYRAPHLCNINNVYKEVSVVTIFSIAYNIPRFLEREIYQSENGTYASRRTALGENAVYDYIYIDALYYIFSFVLPLVILAFVNTRVILVYRATQQRRQRMTSSVRRNTENDNNITLVMIMVVLIFIICQAPARFVQIIWNYQHTCRDFRFYLIHFSNTLEVLNSSVNFLIYCVFHKRFRDIMQNHFCCGLMRSSSKRDSQRMTTTEGLSLEEVQRTTPGSSKKGSSSAKSSTQENNRNGSIPHINDKASTMTRTNSDQDPEAILSTDPILRGEDKSHSIILDNCTEPRDDVTEPLSP